MANLTDLDMSGVEAFTGGGWKPLPEGVYNCILSNSSEQVGKSSGVKYIRIEYTVISGEYEGRKVNENLNLWSANPKASNFAKARLKAICEAVGVVAPKSTEQLHDRKLTLTINVKDNDGKLENEVKKYDPPQAVTTAPKAKAPSKPAPQQTEENSDDMPF